MIIVVVAPTELQRLITEAVESAVSRAGQSDEWIDARTSPLGRRSFLKLAREGAFPASLVGNKYMARRRDVDAYLEHQRIHPESPRPEPPGAPPNAIQPSTQTDASDDPVARALAAGRLRIVKKAE